MPLQHTYDLIVMTISGLALFHQIRWDQPDDIIRNAFAAECSASSRNKNSTCTEHSRMYPNVANPTSSHPPPSRAMTRRSAVCKPAKKIVTIYSTIRRLDGQLKALVGTLNIIKAFRFGGVPGRLTILRKIRTFKHQQLRVPGIRPPLACRV